ncbi:MAG: hypothetical protein COV57_03100 [Candidatus Liptonbacteria bacterium CG11_big_fil_rev_8_21_14_0_20_35_14]|uniref:Uncharacterized protein n=1 Tax=Candidatus Liptonbacteria bacterium CG11_big_fil_rev_8_21_14_0_20_35_14 TaxID=1974634 RepID=A0A2H0N711_9BACT|nr:MAG: hypothetical protein COV57_03100 [Candidatus Liptonbacteria bacterium CG11_big_fil_rev_8_21_14_0_20_35_14]PJB52565.1 MAG: hypothetical protein CO099_11925 [Bdellovibrio sp. CG_4_9_14_3_um_filter_39_7]
MITLVYLLINNLFAQAWIEKNAPRLPDNAPTDMVPVYETVKYVMACGCILVLTMLSIKAANNLRENKYEECVKNLLGMLVLIVGMTINLWR